MGAFETIKSNIFSPNSDHYAFNVLHCFFCWMHFNILLLFAAFQRIYSCLCRLVGEYCYIVDIIGWYLIISRTFRIYQFEFSEQLIKWLIESQTLRVNWSFCICNFRFNQLSYVIWIFQFVSCPRQPLGIFRPLYRSPDLDLMCIFANIYNLNSHKIDIEI